MSKETKKFIEKVKAAAKESGINCLVMADGMLGVTNGHGGRDSAIDKTKNFIEETFG